MASKNSGFTLVELSIVMVIMALLVSGAVAGKALYRISQLKAMKVEIESYKMAIDNFTMQYGGLPGDLKNAVNFWPGTQTENGNNNGKIDTYAESLRAWQQLSLAQMIPGHYSGTGVTLILGENIPKSRYVEGGYSLLWVDDPGGWRDNQNKKLSGNYMLFGNKGTPVNGNELYLSKSLLNPEDAYAMDTKLDNGQPGSGAVLGMNGEGNVACTINGEYNLAITIPACILYIQIQAK
jgi:prepilin-type N-terminal cleavage/methylation domain-containing protein